MLRDPFLDESLVTYLDVSERYQQTVDEMVRLARDGRHREFTLLAAQARALAARLEEARTAMQNKRSREAPPQSGARGESPQS